MFVKIQGLNLHILVLDKVIDVGRTIGLTRRGIVYLSYNTNYQDIQYKGDHLLLVVYRNYQEYMIFYRK